MALASQVTGLGLALLGKLEATTADRNLSAGERLS